MSLDSSIDNENVETIPDEEFEKQFQKQREKLISWPNSKNQIGPNINWHFQKKRYSNEQERTFFFDKIKKKKKTELCKNFELYHDCFYKDECSFAHGVEELRQNCELPKYKAKIGNPSQRIQFAILAIDATTFTLSKQKDYLPMNIY